jgi:Tol biopolymer transport system component
LWLAFACALAAAALGAALAAAASTPARTLRAAPLGVNPLESGANPSLDRSGSTMAFDSKAKNLVPGDANGAVRDVFVADLRTPGSLTLVSRASDGRAGDRDSYDPSVAASGLALAYTSDATTLVPGDTNGVSDVFVGAASATQRVSVGPTGQQGTAPAANPSISSEGDRVAFSTKSALVPGDTNRAEDVYVRDIAAGTTLLVSAARSGRAGNGASSLPSISADGRIVSFESAASDLVASDRNKVADVFVRDLGKKATTRVSVSTGGVAQDKSVAKPFLQVSSISGDGRYVAFDSDGANLVRRDRNQDTDVFVRDTKAKRTVRVSVDSAGVEGDNDSFSPAISDDGRQVAFESFAENLSDDDAPREDVFVHDFRTGATFTGDVAASGARRGPEVDKELLQQVALSGDGSRLGFVSGADNLVAGDTNGLDDVFGRDLTPIGGGVSISGPKRRVTRSSKPKAKATARAPGARLLCRLRAKILPCRSGAPFSLGTLKPGTYTLIVAAGGRGSYWGPELARQVVVVRR